MKKQIKSIMLDNKAKQNTGLLAIVLWILSFLYGGCIAIRSWMFEIGILKVRRLDSPVICVGNIVMGGSGKTPVVEYVARYLIGRGRKAAILTRGYTPKGSSSAGSDEADMLKAKLPNCPVIIGKDRFSLAQSFLNQQRCDVFIMDDGFQHRQLYRNFNVAVIDAGNPFGNGYLIPRGILREPLNALNRADCILLTKVDQSKNLKALQSQLKALIPDVPVIETRHAPVHLYDPVNQYEVDLRLIKDKQVFALSGIGHPESFNQTVQSLAASVKGTLSFDDHHEFSNEDVQEIIRQAQSVKAQCVVTTEKDMVRLQAHLGAFAKSIDLYVLGIELKVIQGEELFHERLIDLL